MRWTMCAPAALAICGAAMAADYDEAMSGDLSTDALAPTQVAVSLGSNVISGRVADPDDTRDYFTFSIAPGEALSAIFLLDWTDAASGSEGNRGFIHIDDGMSSVIPSGATAGDFLGGSHLDRAIFPNDTDNVLATLDGAPQGGVGFALPLGPGDYTINVQQTSALPTAYSLDLVVVPGPASGILVGLAGLLTMSRRR